MQIANYCLDNQGRNWRPGSLRRQDISGHVIDYVEYVVYCLIYCGRISTTCVVWMWRNDIKCKYMFMFPLKNLARKGLINMQTDVLFVCAAPVLPCDGHKGAVYLKQCSFVTGCTGGIVLLTWRDPSDHNINCCYGLDRKLCVHCISVATESGGGGASFVYMQLSLVWVVRELCAASFGKHCLHNMKSLSVWPKSTETAGVFWIHN